MCVCLARILKMFTIIRNMCIQEKANKRVSERDFAHFFLGPSIFYTSHIILHYHFVTISHHSLTLFSHLVFLERFSFSHYKKHILNNQFPL